MLTDDEICAMLYPDANAKFIKEFVRDFPRLHARNRRVFDSGYRAGMKEAAEIAEESTSSAFPVAAHVAIRAAAGEES